MRLLIQRVSRASVYVDNRCYATIPQGLLLFIGIALEDREADVNWLAQKVCSMRIFNDKNGLMNLSIKDTGGSVLAVSQFTLLAQTQKGNRPSFIKAARPEIAIPLYEQFIAQLRQLLGENKVAHGVFGATMSIELINEGPVTLWIDSKKQEY
jgi:D-tyrosyl-tRNA(Tyr) deacylase